MVFSGSVVDEVGVLVPVGLHQDAVDVVDVDGLGGAADGLDQAADTEIAGLTQHAVGKVTLRNAQGETDVPLDHENLYACALRAFVAAILGEGPPAATGEDGVRSLATALAVLEATQTGRRTAVRFH
jgi:predicted dehydrogenase